MVEQPYTVCRPVTTCRQEVVETGYYERQYTTVPGPVVERKVRVPVAGMRLRAAGLFGCLHHKKKVTATVAVQCPPRTVSQRVFVSRPMVRNVSETRYVRETMVRQVPVQTCRMVAEERVQTIPVTTCQYVAEEHVEPYEVQTCQMVAEERVQTIPVTTCQYVSRGARRALPGADLRDGGGGAGADHPRDHLPVRRRGARRALRGPDLPDGGRGASPDGPRHHLSVCQRAACRTRARDDVPDGRRDGVAPGAGVRGRAGPGHRQPVRGPRRPADRSPCSSARWSRSPSRPAWAATDRVRPAGMGIGSKIHSTAVCRCPGAPPSCLRDDSTD